MLLLHAGGSPADAAYCPPPCGTPVSGAELPAAVDCLFILRAAVGASSCEPECACRVTGGETVSAVDALTCLRTVVDPSNPLSCNCEPPTTTTTMEPPLGVCTLSKIACGSLFDCEEECVGDCEGKRDGCYVYAEGVFDDCMEDCETGDDLCFRLCLLHRRSIEVGCRRAFEECVLPCDGELCEGLHDGPRFEDTGGTIIDHQTRLEWEKKTPENVVLHFSWSATAHTSKANGTVFTGLLADLNNCRDDDGCLGGHCDWRLPSSSGERTTGKPAELESLRRVLWCPSYEICDHPVFGPTFGDRHWSGTTWKVARNNAWAITFGTVYPQIREVPKFWMSSARAVRDYR